MWRLRREITENNVRIVGIPESRAVIAQLHCYKDCNDILRLARTKQKIQVGDMTISVYPDFTARVAKAWAAFNNVRRMLKDVPGVRFGILFPARFRITLNRTKSFSLILKLSVHMFPKTLFTIKRTDCCSQNYHPWGLSRWSLSFPHCFALCLTLIYKLIS